MKTGITLSTAALMVLLTIAGFVVPQSEAQEAKRIRVRRLTCPDTVNFKMVRGKAKNNPMTLKNAFAVRKLVGKEKAKALLAGVNFAKEMIVLVLWETGGPPQGYLNYEAKGNGLNFYVQGPPLVDERGRAIIRKNLLLHGVAFFAISRDVAVTYEPQERPYGGR